MIDNELRERVIEGFEMSYRYSNVDEDNTLVPQQLVLDALALLKVQEPKPVKRWNTKEASPYCPNIDACGRLLEEGWAYCPYCGQAVKWDG